MTRIIDYCHQKLNAGVAWWVPYYLWIKDLRKLVNIKKALNMLGIEDHYPAGYPKEKIFHSFARKVPKISCKPFPRKICFT